MPPPPVASVVIPTYNQPALLLETLDTVMAQTFADLEVVVIDDGSTDDTAARVREYAARHDRPIRLVTQPNGGIGAARNRGIDEATGRYVALLDHDDLWMPRKLEEQVGFMEARPRCVATSTLWASTLTPDHPEFDPARICDADGIIPRPSGRWPKATSSFILRA